MKDPMEALNISLVFAQASTFEWLLAQKKIRKTITSSLHCELNLTDFE